MPTLLYPRKTYKLDHENRFAWFSSEWNTCNSELYLGRVYFDILEGPTVKHLYQNLFQVVRHHEGQALQIPIRCDSPESRVFLTLDLMKDEADGLQGTITCLSMAPHLPFDECVTPTGSELIKMCSWCQSLYNAEKQVWIPFDEALERLAILQCLPLPTISHACCPSCLQAIRGKTDAYTRGRR